jgi:hypothetical protein
MESGLQKFAFCLNICIARHMARVYGQNEAVAITRAARKVRDATKDQKMYELAKAYSRDLAPMTVDGKRLTGDEVKIMSVANLERDMKAEGLL